MLRPTALLLLPLLALAPAARALDADELRKVVQTLDDRQRNSGDWKALCYMELRSFRKRVIR